MLLDELRPIAGNHLLTIEKKLMSKDESIRQAAALEVVVFGLIRKYWTRIEYETVWEGHNKTTSPDFYVSGNSLEGIFIEVTQRIKSVDPLTDSKRIREKIIKKCERFRNVGYLGQFIVAIGLPHGASEIVRPSLYGTPFVVHNGKRVMVSFDKMDPSGLYNTRGSRYILDHLLGVLVLRSSTKNIWIRSTDATEFELWLNPKVMRWSFRESLPLYLPVELMQDIHFASKLFGPDETVLCEELCVSCTVDTCLRAAKLSTKTFSDGIPYRSRLLGND